MSFYVVFLEYIIYYFLEMNISIINFLMLYSHTVHTVLYQQDVIKDKIASCFNRIQILSFCLQLFIFK